MKLTRVTTVGKEPQGVKIHWNMEYKMEGKELKNCRDRPCWEGSYMVFQGLHTLLLRTYGREGKGYKSEVHTWVLA